VDQPWQIDVELDSKVRVEQIAFNGRDISTNKRDIAAQGDPIQN
jgi:hypothetical protein